MPNIDQQIDCLLPVLRVQRGNPGRVGDQLRDTTVSEVDAKGLPTQRQRRSQLTHSGVSKRM
jgi:hypothetical protein